jgi:hypothetical protein
MDCGPPKFDAKVHFVALTAALPANASPPPKAKEHADEGVVTAAIATSPTFVEPFPNRRAVKLRGTERTMVARTALHDGEQDPPPAVKLVPSQLPGSIVTVALFDPDV